MLDLPTFIIDIIAERMIAAEACMTRIPAIKYRIEIKHKVDNGQHDDFNY